MATSQEALKRYIFHFLRYKVMLCVLMSTHNVPFFISKKKKKKKEKKKKKFTVNYPKSAAIPAGT